MKKVIVYSTTTGNTQKMAEAIAEGAKGSGADVTVYDAGSADAADVLSADVIFLGSPAMGTEELDSPMEDFYESIEKGLSGKRVAIFGSYDWGDGEWLREWADRIAKAGGTVVNGEGTMANLEPDDAAISACRELGRTAA